jgi:hypothetical protein
MTTADLAAMSSTAIRVLGAETIAALDATQIGALTTGQVSALTTAQIGAMDVADLNALTTKQFAVLSSAQVRAITAEQADAMSTDDLAAISANSIKGLSVAAMGTLNSAQLDALTTSQWASLGTAQIAAIGGNEFRTLDADHIKALTTAQARALTEEQIVAFTTAQIPFLETADIRAMTMTQVNWFEAADLAAMSTAQTAALNAVSPIILDLDGNGVRTVAASEGVVFDVTASGSTAGRVGWVGAGDALLVRDRNGDGSINDGRELYGSGTVGADGKRAGHGFAALEAEDSNRDGKITAADKHFDELKLWVDTDRDGKTDLGELRGLAEFGVVELSTGFVKSDRMDEGNLLGLVGSYTKADGSQHEMIDVWFAKDGSTTAAPPPIGELLAAPGPVLPGAPEPTAATVAVAAPVAMHRAVFDDEQRQQPLI